MMLAVAIAVTPMVAQAPATAAQRAAGTVKSTNATGLTLTTTAGQDVVVTVPDAVKVLMVAPGSKDLKSATPGTLSDVTVGDKVLVVGDPGASGLTATRVILMKAGAIAATHQAEEAAWTKGGGGIVKSVDAATGTIVIASGLKTVTVMVTPQTIVRRYAGDSVRFADAKVSSIAEIQKGDQLRVRGTKSADGSVITADELVTGMFKNYSGLISAIDASAGTVTLKDLTTKKSVTVAVGPNSDVRRIPPMLAERVAARMKGTGAGAPGGAAGPPAGAPGAPASHGAPGEAGAQRERSAGSDLSQMLSRLPTETLAGLKVGDAVMIVATSPGSDTATPMAVTLLAGVDAILSASPSGQTMTLSPWSLGGGGGEGGDTGGGPGGSALERCQVAEGNCRFPDRMTERKARARASCTETGLAEFEFEFEFRSSGVRMLVDGLCGKLKLGWLGVGLAGLLMAGVAMAMSAQTSTPAKAPATAAGVQAGKTRVHGVVTDPDGALIPGATVTLSGNGPAVKATSGSDGSYSAAVTPGTYTVTVTMPGFATYTATGLAIGAANGMTLNVEAADWRAVAGGDGEFEFCAAERGSGFECKRDGVAGQGPGCAVG